MVDRVAVIGGGAVGLQAANRLAERDIAVTLFEAAELGSGASGRAAGICYDAYADRRDAAIAAESLGYYREHDLLAEQPYCWFATDEETAAAIDSQAERMAEHGQYVEVVEPATLDDRYPALVTEDLETAAIAHNAGYVHPESYLSHLGERARNAGVTIHTETPATLTADGKVQAGGRVESDAVLVAAGAETAAVCTALAGTLALGCYRTQALVAEPVGDVPIYYDASAERYARPTPDGVLAGDGSAMYDGDPAEYDRSADETFLTDRLNGLRKRLRERPEIDRSWAGLCTATPDRAPLLGTLESGVFVATGFCGHGLMRSPALGRAVADQILGREPITGFEPSRFDGDETVSLPLGVSE